MLNVDGYYKWCAVMTISEPPVVSVSPRSGGRGANICVDKDALEVPVKQQMKPVSTLTVAFKFKLERRTVNEKFYGLRLSEVADLYLHFHRKR